MLPPPLAAAGTLRVGASADGAPGRWAPAAALFAVWPPASHCHAPFMPKIAKYHDDAQLVLLDDGSDGSRLPLFVQAALLPYWTHAGTCSGRRPGRSSPAEQYSLPAACVLRARTAAR